MEKKQGHEPFRYVKNATTGITLIALAITIILLLILAAIVINLAIGENGILNYVKEAKEKTEEEVAREKLELVLLDLQAKKYTDQTYNETTYIDTVIRENGMAVNGDVVFVDGWQFQLDRSVPKIGISLGRGELEEQIQIIMTSETSINYEKATIHIEIDYADEITSIILNGEEITIPEKQDGKYVIEKEVIENGNYSVIAKASENKYNLKNIKITDITEDMDIYTVEDMIVFRDKVNSGRTFSRRTVRLMNDIDLNENKYTIAEDGTLTFDNSAIQWIPIGNETHYFKGTFEGDGKSIEGIYIHHNSLDGQGLFSTLGEGGNIQNITIKGSITSRDYSGGVVAYSYGTIINCHNHVKMQGTNCISGIAAKNIGIIEECSNYAEVICSDSAAGICGINVGIIRKCYNVGNIVANTTTAGGIVANNGYVSSNGFIYNCYNNATVSSGRNYATSGLAGANGVSGPVGYVYNSYTIQNETIDSGYRGRVDIQNCYTTNAKTKLEELNTGIDVVNGKDTEQPWIEDIENINNGYPILKWQLEQ